jgi:DNA polymerase
MGIATKRAAYESLVAARKTCDACDSLGLTNPSRCERGAFDSEHVGPWSKWQGNLNAPLLVIGQDWGDTAYFIKNAGGEAPNNPTNVFLMQLLASIGITIGPPEGRDGFEAPLFFTNAILCLKQGGLQAAVRSEWFTNCGARFLKPTIDLVAPSVVVTLGERPYRAMRELYKLPVLPFASAVDVPEGFALDSGTIRYFPLYHCGRRILNTHRPLARQIKDWEKVGRALSTR